jgi:hypothetical protein
MEIFDAKLYKIAKASEIIVKLVREEKTIDIRILCNNQAVVKRIKTTVTQLGLEYILSKYQHVSIL